jgi:uncharacterized protein (TIGR02145 family)
MTSTIYKARIQDLRVLLLLISILLVYPACQPLEEETTLLMSVDHMEYVSEGSYKIYGTLATMGKEELTGFGICWSEARNPDIAGFFEKLETPLSQGEFIVTVAGLSPSTTYYFRAFAQMNTLMEYSAEKQFTTRPAAEDMVMDVQGNIYKTAKIGKQVWMAENLRSTLYSDRTPIPYVEDSALWFHFTRESLGYCWYGNSLSQGVVYGALYSWPAATRAFNGISAIEEGVQGVCPDGWHLPNDDEWKELEMYLGMSQEESDAEKWRGSDQGGRLKQEGNQYWDAPNSGAADEVAFKALPGGYRHGSAAFFEMSKTARFWTSTQNGYGYAWYRGVDYDRTDIYRDFSGVYRGHSVRCVKDD